MRLMFDIHGRIMVEQVIELSAEDDPPLTPKPLHVASPVEDMDVDDEDSDEEYVTNSNESGSSKNDDEEEQFVPDTPIEASRREMRRVRGAHTYLAPTISQDHQQLDNSLFCCVILPLIQSSPSISISIL
ncbi:hypothetical protein Ahy_A04g018279 [Arachis hypogaea]|uniref:Uncharacterized protein n=1 Tax=Arachis hypogaea TaxID=3818 RepID=A0A445DD93_ARAHY|nr:hypothetical protein Ahy_A04g018279 [Arachis hypogaea]